MKATIVDLRYRMKSVLAALDRGEPVTILHRGREKARLTPLASMPKPAKSSAHPAFGMWKTRQDLEDVPGHVRKLRKLRFDAL
jgi:antitoxin (DNA-binding transcriptional repressor) of toxin-antitoxin stability system